jgi:hypothetical protein
MFAQEMDMAIYLRAKPARNTRSPIAAWTVVIGGFLLLFGSGGVFLRLALAGNPEPDADRLASANDLYHHEAAAEDVHDSEPDSPALAKEPLAPPVVSVPVQPPVTIAKQPAAINKVETEPAPPAAAKPAPTNTPVAEARPRPAAFAVKRRQHLSDEELERLLAKVPEIDIESVPQTSARLMVWGKAAQVQNRHFSGPVLLRNERRDLAGLPFRLGLDCRAGKEAAENLHVLSRKLRGHMQSTLPTDGSDCRIDAERLRQLLMGTDDGRSPWLQTQALSTLVQMLQVENTAVRLLLVDFLARNPDAVATRELARRAVFDLSAKVREGAVRALRERPPQEVRPVLLGALRYPWPAVADHAAEALVSLRDRGAVPELRALLAEPSPSAPERAPGQPSMVREVVRINHLGNCLLCHAPSFSRTDLVRGAVPARNQPLPAAPSRAEYYERGSVFVRADVTYLKQDFSSMLAISNPGPWPAYQRYDYVIRKRPATALELSKAAKRPATYPQRESVRFALRELAGEPCEDLKPAPGIDEMLPLPGPPEQHGSANDAAAPETELGLADTSATLNEERQESVGGESDSRYLVRNSEGKGRWTKGAYERGVRAEKEGRYLLASTCYYNALTIYPDTPVAEKARIAVDRVENLLQAAAIAHGRGVFKQRD